LTLTPRSPGETFVVPQSHTFVTRSDLLAMSDADLSQLFLRQDVNQQALHQACYQDRLVLFKCSRPDLIRLGEKEWSDIRSLRSNEPTSDDFAADDVGVGWRGCDRSWAWSEWLIRPTRLSRLQCGTRDELMTMSDSDHAQLRVLHSDGELREFHESLWESTRPGSAHFHADSEVAGWADTRSDLLHGLGKRIVVLPFDDPVPDPSMPGPEESIHFLLEDREWWFTSSYTPPWYSEGVRDGGMELIGQLSKNSRVTVSRFSNDIRIGLPHRPADAIAIMQRCMDDPKKGDASYCLYDAIIAAIDQELRLNAKQTTLIVVTTGVESESTTLDSVARKVEYAKNALSNLNIVFLVVRRKNIPYDWQRVFDHVREYDAYGTPQAFREHDAYETRLKHALGHAHRLRRWPQ